MKTCRICGKPVKKGRYCRDKCEGETHCLTCGELKDTREFYDYRDTGGSFKSTCAECILSKRRKEYKPAGRESLRCPICKEYFERVGSQLICEKKECKEVMKRIRQRYYLRRK